MLVILMTVITQGMRIPSELRGAVKGSLLVKPGVFQAIGVISFGQSSQCRHEGRQSRLTLASLRLPYVPEEMVDRHFVLANQSL